MFAAAGVMAIEHADFVGVERLALVTGTQTLSGAHPEICIPACTAALIHGSKLSIGIQNCPKCHLFV